MGSDLAELLERFIATFDTAIRDEMNAIRERSGPFEIPIGAGQSVPEADNDAGCVYTFDLLGSGSDNLQSGSECSLRQSGTEVLVSLIDVGPTRVTLRAPRALKSAGEQATLVVYPWFLYEKLREVLSAMPKRSDLCVEMAFMLFGKRTPKRRPARLLAEHKGLNASQHRAVVLSAESELAFVWGPPGTGKTHTLAHIASELLAQGKRVLITSTTNAAVDQALAGLIHEGAARDALERGQLIRIGHSDAPNCGASLGEVVGQRATRSRDRLSALRTRLPQVARQLADCERVLARISESSEPAQASLFGDAGPRSDLTARDITSIFPVTRVAAFLALPAASQETRLDSRLARLTHLQRLMLAKREELVAIHRQTETEVIEEARLILATMTGTYMSRWLQAERFDVVIVEEAGMAILPTLFYCAALAREKVVIVGDPRQLPAIVQSRSETVRKFMGRNIFEVTVPDPARSDIIVLLDTQYRMHRAIGELVSSLFYDGRLVHGEITNTREKIAALDPYPGQPIVALDLVGSSSCATPTGSFSRFNELSAQLCCDLATTALRAGIESVAIITPYAEQSRRIRKLLKQARLDRDRADCSTVHRFQGHERDLVIVDTVDAPPLRPGVLLAGDATTGASRNLLGVSLSRARGKLILVSEIAYFEREAPRSEMTRVLREAIDVGLRVRHEGGS